MGEGAIHRRKPMRSTIENPRSDPRTDYMTEESEILLEVDVLPPDELLSFEDDKTPVIYPMPILIG